MANLIRELGGRPVHQAIQGNVKRARLARGWKQSDLAERLKRLDSGLAHQTQIARLESGTMKRVTVQNVLELAAALEVAPINLIVSTEDQDLEVSKELGIDAAGARAWIRGELELNIPDTSWTDSPEFYYQHVSKTEKAALAVPGYRLLLDLVRLSGRRRASGERERLKKMLTRIQREVERQLDEIDLEEEENSGSH